MTISRNIEFNPNWFNEDGLPTRLIEWVRSNITPNDTEDTLVYSVQEIGGLPYTLYVTVPLSQSWFGESNVLKGRVELPNNRAYVLSVGEIVLTVKGVETERWINYGIGENPEWRLDWRMERRYYREYGVGNCPSVMGHAYHHIDKMLFSILGKGAAFSSASFISQFGTGGVYVDRHNTKPTPDKIEKIYNYVAKRFNSERLADGQIFPDAPVTEETKQWVMRWYKALFRAILLGDPNASKAKQLLLAKTDHDLYEKYPRMHYAYMSDLGMYVPVDEFDSAEQAEAWLKRFDHVSVEETEFFCSREMLRKVFLK